MEISSIGNNYSIDIPDYIDLNVQSINKDFDVPDTNGDQIATSEIGAAAVVTAEAVAQDEIKTQELQQNFLYNLDELKMEISQQNNLIAF